MSCAAKPTINPLTTSNGYLISIPAIFTTKTSSYRCLSIPSKSIKLHGSCFSYSSSSPFLLSLKKNTHSLKKVAFVARISDWAQQEEYNTAGVDEEESEFRWSEEGREKVDAIGETESGGEEGFLEGGEEYRELNEDAKLFVGNLPHDIDNEKIAQFFEQAGIVEVAEVIYVRETGQSCGFGFVTMRTVEEAEKAMEMFHQYELNGRTLNVNKAASRGSRVEFPPREFELNGRTLTVNKAASRGSRVESPREFERSPAFRLYVSNLPWYLDSTRLEQVFSEHGKVVQARVVLDRETGRSRGFGFVTMSTEAESNDAIANLDGQDIGGRSIRVNVAEERPRRFF